MIREIDQFYLEKQEPIKSCLLALKDIISNYNNEFEHLWRYRLPCFMYRGRIFCYLWVDRKTQIPYIAIGKGVQIEHSDLIQGNRTFVKLLMIEPEEDIPIEVAQVIKDLPKEKQQTLIRALSVKRHYSGPLPDGESIKIYDEVIPNGGDRLMSTVEKQLDHRIEMEKTGVNRTFNQSSTGQWMGFAIAIVFGFIKK